MQQRIEQYIVPVCLFLISLMLFTWGLQEQEIISFDSRFYLFALEMWRHGPKWFPTTYMEPYPDYTAASTFLIYGFAKLMGGLSKLAAVLPSAIAAAITVVCTYLIGILHHRRWGWHAVGILLLTVAFVKSARAVALDMFPCAITALCFYIVHSADVLRKRKREWWLYPLIMLGFLFRGPIGLVIPTGVVCTYYLMTKHFKKFFVFGFFAFCLLMLCTLGLLYLAYQVGGQVFMQDVFRMQIAGRIDSQYFPLYFYFTNSLTNYAIAYPFAIFVIIGVLIARKNLRDYEVLLQLVGWALIILIGMSIPGEKKTRYILPFVPALALLASYPLSVTTRQSYFIWLRNIMSGLLLFSPSILFGLTMYITHIIVRTHLSTPVQSSLMTFFAVMQIVSLVLYFTVSTTQRISAILACTLLAYFVAYFKIVEPLEFAIDSGREFVLKVETLRAQKNAELVFYRESPDGLPIKYLINMTQEVKPTFLKTYDELHAYHAKAFFITTGTTYDELTSKQKRSFVIVESGKLGHVDLIVFRRKK